MSGLKWGQVHPVGVLGLWLLGGSPAIAQRLPSPEEGNTPSRLTPNLSEPTPETTSEPTLKRRDILAPDPTEVCLVDTAVKPEAIMAVIDQAAEQPEVVGNDEEIIDLEKLKFIGNRVFSNEDLQRAIMGDPGDSDNPVATHYTLTDLRAIIERITKLYNDERYINSWATIPEQVVQNGEVTIAIVEGGLQEIRLRRPEGTPNLLASAYICDRLALAARPLNLNHMLDALRQLQLNPLIKKVDAELTPGDYLDSQILTVTVEEANSLQLTTGFDNGRPPSVGTQRSLVRLSEGNLSGIGDRLDLTFSHTEGSNNLESRYVVPVNARDGTVSLTLGLGTSKVTESPFDYLDLRGDSLTWGLQFRQPIYKTYQSEVALSLGLGNRFSQTSILGFDFPLSEGADDEGRLRVTSLTFGQEWTQRGDRDFLGLRSQFSLGFDAFGATINETAPDSRFFHWQGQGTWLHRFPNQSQLLVQGLVQLGDRPLLAQEQFTLGGLGTVRGYRQDIVSRDNGAFLSVEYQHPLWGKPNKSLGQLSAATFLDWGAGWQSPQRGEKDYQTLASWGLGLLWTPRDDVTVQAYWGLPLLEVDSRNNTLQENGFHFVVQSRLEL